MLNKINISPKRQKLIIYIVLTLVTLAVFWQVNKYDFVNGDDHVYVTENIHVQSGITLDGIRWAFSTTCSDFWHPLLWLSFMFDYQLHGLNAGGYHLTNLILHVLSTLLLFWLFNRMTGAVWRSAFVAALFALHPLHVESVAWINERKDVLSAFFWMLTLCLYVYYTEKPVIKRYLLVVFSFVCALMSKPMVVTLPVVMILLDYWPLKRFNSYKGNLILLQLREKIPLFLFSAVFSVITLQIYHRPFVKLIPLDFRLARASVSFVNYLGKMFWPHDLAVVYPSPEQIPLWHVLGSFLLIVVISAAVIVIVKRFPYLFVGWLWYAVTILPTLGIIQTGIYWTHDHYTYLPSIGIIVGLAWGIPSLIKSEGIRKKVLFPAAIAILFVMSILSWHQCGYWKNSEKIWNHSLEVTKNNLWAHVLLSYALSDEGKFEEAIYNYNRMILQQFKYVNYAVVYNNRGNAYSGVGNKKHAIEDYSEAIRLQPDYVEAYYNRGTVYIESGQYQKAVQDYTETIRIKSDYILAYLNRGMAYSKLGQYQPAIKDYNEAIRLKPDYAEAYNNRGAVYLNQGNIQMGCLDAIKACELGSCKVLEVAKSNRVCH